MRMGLQKVTVTLVFASLAAFADASSPFSHPGVMKYVRAVASMKEASPNVTEADTRNVHDHDREVTRVESESIHESVHAQLHQNVQRRINLEVNAIAEKFKCGWLPNDDVELNCLEYDSKVETVDLQCGVVEWDCSSTNNTCTQTLSATYMKCALDILYAGCPTNCLSDSWTCSTYPEQEMAKSEAYHGSLNDQECEMDDDKMVVHESIECKSDGPHVTYKVHVLDGRNPTSCSSNFTCLSSSESEETLTCVIVTSGSPSPGSSYTPPGLSPDAQSDITAAANEQISQSGATRFSTFLAFVTSAVYLA